MPDPAEGFSFPDALAADCSAIRMAWKPVGRTYRGGTCRKLLAAAGILPPSVGKAMRPKPCVGGCPAPAATIAAFAIASVHFLNIFLQLASLDWRTRFGKRLAARRGTNGYG